MNRKSTLALALWAGFSLVLCAAETASGPTQPAETVPPANFTPRPKLLPFKILGLFERTVEPVILFERPEDIGKASFIRSGAGEVQPLSINAKMEQGDTILIGQQHQVFGRFGDGTAVYMTPFTVMEMTERQQTGDKSFNTLLSVFQGAVRVNIPRTAAPGTFLVRIPNVKEGPIDISGPGSHFFLFPDPLSVNTEWHTLDMVLHVWAGECEVKVPLTKTATSDITITVDKGTTVKVASGMALRMTFRYEPMDDPKLGGPVYQLFLDVTKLETLPPPRIVQPTSNDIPPPNPPNSDGG